VVDISPAPNIDAMATNGGIAVQCRPQLTGGNPPAITSYAAQLAARAAALANLLTQLEHARDQLHQTWPAGQGSTAARNKLTSTLTQVGNLIQAITAFVRELNGAAGKLTVAYTGANSAIRSTDPTVGALRSNPYTQAAASALATGSTSIIAAFLRAIASVLSAIGQANMAQILQAVAGVAGAVGQLLSGTGTPATPSSGTATAGTTVTTPTLPDLGTLTSSTTGTTPATTSVTPATTGTNTTVGTGTTTGAGAGAGTGSSGFIPVTPGTGTAATPPATATTVPATTVPATTVPATTVPATTTTVPATASGGATQGTPVASPGHHVTVTVNADGSVRVDADMSAQVDVVETGPDGTEIDRHITVDADGSTVAVG
jgi:uncharacterized protein YukE